MNQQILSILIPAAVVIFGWIAVHELNVRRDTLVKRRDLRVQYLIDAYRRLEANAQRSNPSPEVRKAFESAVADIQLLGTRKQIDALQQFLCQFKGNAATPSVSDVLELQRDDLRKELNLEVYGQSIHLLRFTEQKAGQEPGMNRRLDVEHTVAADRRENAAPAER